MFSSSAVWVLMVMMQANQAPVPVGTFSSKDACVAAGSEATYFYPGSDKLPVVPLYGCVPVEKPIR